MKISIQIILCALSAARATSPLQSRKTPDLFSLHRALVEIESITPNEYSVGRYLVDYLESYNLTVSTQRVGPEPDSVGSDRFNIHAYIGTSPESRTLISSHIDTVPPFWPYELRNDGTEIWGRGSVDAKGAVAAQIVAFLELHAAGKLTEGDASLLFVVGEETGGLGMRAANDLSLAWDAVVFGEPTEGKLACGHKGILGFKIKAHGKAAHSGYPWLGASANSLLVAALTGLENAKGRLPSSKKYGETTINIGRIEGGVAANVVAESAYSQCAMRLAAGTPQEAKRLILETLKNATEPLIRNSLEHGTLEVDFTGGGYAPVNIDCDVKGFERLTVNYGTDIPNLKGDHKRYLYGPGSILVAHSDHEHLTVKELKQAVEGYKQIIMATLAHPEEDSDAYTEL